MAPFGGKRGKNPYRDANGRFSGPGGSTAGKAGKAVRSAAVRGLKGNVGTTRTRGAGLAAQQAARRGQDPDLAAALWERSNTAPPVARAAPSPRTGGNLTGTGYRKK